MCVGSAAFPPAPPPQPPPILHTESQLKHVHNSQCHQVGQCFGRDLIKKGAILPPGVSEWPLENLPLPVLVTSQVGVST